MKLSLIALSMMLAGGAAAAQSASPSSPGSSALLPMLQGVWTLNHDLSDKAPAQNDTADRPGNGAGGGRRGGGFGGGGFGGGRRGGFGGGGFGGGGGGGRQGPSQDAQRQRDALRDVMTPPERLTIVQTDSTIIFTSEDGRTVRLAPTGKKIKEENTGIERKTSWQADKLVSEVTGIGSGKITETYAVDASLHQLRVTTELPKRNGETPAPLKRVYDLTTDQ